MYSKSIRKFNSTFWYYDALDQGVMIRVRVIRIGPGEGSLSQIPEKSDLSIL